MASTTPNPTTELTEGPISQETVELLLKSYLKDVSKFIKRDLVIYASNNILLL